MKIKPSIPKGMRDFSSEVMSKRNYIFDTVKQVFECYGYIPLETPAMENTSTLTGKYGEEGDKLIFKILNSGDFLSKITLDPNTNSKQLSSKISEKALRYDLTVPFARYVAQNRNNITFPFKRYQMQNVWRADKPQKGRYREFFQCDADVIGTNSLLCEVELIQLYDDVFTKLNIPNIEICLNNRKLLLGMVELMGASDKFTEIVTILDKINNLGLDKVKESLKKIGVNNKGINIMTQIISAEKIDNISDLLSKSEFGKEGINELQFIIETVSSLGLKSSDLRFDITLARGLDYYTGTILEAKVKNIDIGSVGGGGRYDDLTGIFGLNDISGIGISFGVDRIYLVMEELNIFPVNIDKKTQLMFVNFGSREASYCLGLLKQLRDVGVSSEIYPKDVKIKKQMEYANKKGVKFVVIIGEDEMDSGLITVKEMETGEQEKLSIEDIIQRLV